jgi:hypothetical protein
MKMFYVWKNIDRQVTPCNYHDDDDEYNNNNNNKDIGHPITGH